MVIGSSTTVGTDAGCAGIVCHGCGLVHENSTIKILPDGRQVGLQSEEWRHHCELQWAMKLPDRVGPRSKKTTKAGYLQKVREARGDAAADRLREDMVRAWKASR